VNVVRVSNETELAELVRRIMAGDAGAEDEVVRRYTEGVSVIIGRIVQSHSVTEDLFQETFIKALEKIRHGDVREPERLSGFICAMAKFIAIEHMRKARQMTNHEEVGRAELISDPEPSQLERLCQEERDEIIRQVIDELKVKRDREIIFDYYIAEKDKDQICAEQGLTREQFNRVIFRALNRYKELYLKRIGKP
jgi:RNA polymerase sigma-70 factor (ECF subfamily)